MIQKINQSFLNQIIDLGKQYEPNFFKKYNINNYINSDIYMGFCYIINQNVVGFVLITVIYENVDIEIIFVDKMFRNKKIATQMLEYLFDNFDNKNFMLEVSKKNQIAYKLYKKLGFKSIGIRKKYYDGIDAIIMKR